MINRHLTGQKLLDTITGFQKGLKFPTSRSSESDRPRSNSSTPSVTVTSPSGATLPRSTLPVGLNRDFVVIRTDDIKRSEGFFFLFDFHFFFLTLLYSVAGLGH